MADLQVCYFCGSGPDDSLGEYAVVPPDLEPTDEQQLSVVLCPDCRGKLTTVVEPMVEAAKASGGSGGETMDAGDDDAGAVDAGAVDADDTAGTDATADDTSGASAPDDGSAGSDVTDATASAEADPSRADASAEPDGPDDPVEDAEGDDERESSGGDVPADAGDGVSVSPPDAGDDEDEGVSIDPLQERGSGESGSGDGQGTARGGESDADAEQSPTPSPDRTPPHADDELVGRNNEAYNKTLRLLQNREFPVERHEIEQVAANAYQLDPQEVSDAIDSLIQKGLLTQEGGHLQRP